MTETKTLERNLIFITRASYNTTLVMFNYHGKCSFHERIHLHFQLGKNRDQLSSNPVTGTPLIQEAITSTMRQSIMLFKVKNTICTNCFELENNRELVMRHRKKRR
jgi:hypothetical protein